MNSDKKIYLALTQTGTILSRAVKLVTRDEYNHISISLEKGLSSLYSFGRRYAYNPFVAGFVTESATSGTFGRFRNTLLLLLELPVEAWVYSAIGDELVDMASRGREYKYNYLGLLLALFGKRRGYGTRFYCSEFVQYILSKYGLGLSRGASEAIRPSEFSRLPGAKIIYEGKLSDYARVASGEELPARALWQM